MRTRYENGESEHFPLTYERKIRQGHHLTLPHPVRVTGMREREVVALNSYPRLGYAPFSQNKKAGAPGGDRLSSQI